MAALRIPGLQVAVVHAGRVALRRSYGVASVELGVPMTDTTVLAVNSVTKAFTGVAAMRLVQAGRLDLSAPVSRYLPDLPDAWRGVTVRHLLSHTSGLPDVVRAPTVETDAAAAWAWVRAQPVRFRPGARFDYCQTNYTLVQRVVNRLTGAPPDAPLAGEQLALAGLRRTAYGDATEVVPGKAPTYRYTYAPASAPPAAGGAPPPGVLRPVTERFLPFRRASSGLNRTAEELARWAVALRPGRLLDSASLATMWTPVAFTDGRVGQWALGWQVLRRGRGRALGMTGGGRAAVYVYPEHDVAVAVLTNLAGAFPEDFVDRVAAVYAPGLTLTGVPALRVALDERGYGHAAAAAAELARADPALRWDEAELNDWGYRLLGSGRPRDGLEVLKLVAALFPRSANAYDSLGEAFAANGDRAAAIANYERALALDPANRNAADRLRALKRPGGGWCAGCRPKPPGSRPPGVATRAAHPVVGGDR